MTRWVKARGQKLQNIPGGQTQDSALAEEKPSNLPPGLGLQEKSIPLQHMEHAHRSIIPKAKVGIGHGAHPLRIGSAGIKKEIHGHGLVIDFLQRMPEPDLANLGINALRNQMALQNFFAENSCD